MSDVQPPGPPAAGSVQVEQIRLNLDALTPEQVEQLRARLKELASGFEDAAGAMAQARPIEAHSSHRDTDGWI
ncbi:MAG: hypothetical protein M3276_04150 [Actinomycetota bacterium]|nr:hypothetical protein [Actinomycetota bacterium]